jgi:hypothetical protein
VILTFDSEITRLSIRPGTAAADKPVPLLMHRTAADITVAEQLHPFVRLLVRAATRFRSQHPGFERFGGSSNLNDGDWVGITGSSLDQTSDGAPRIPGNRQFEE